jgi:hypothetical protein
MAFGLMVKKWCILQHPSMIRLKNVKRMVLAIARLHNFCINERLGTSAFLQMMNDPEQLELNNNDRVVRMQAAVAEYQNNSDAGFSNWSFNRDRMKRKIAALNLQRPLANRINRNNNI